MEIPISFNAHSKGIESSFRQITSKPYFPAFCQTYSWTPRTLAAKKGTQRNTVNTINIHENVHETHENPWNSMNIHEHTSKIIKICENHFIKEPWDTKIPRCKEFGYRIDLDRLWRVWVWMGLADALMNWQHQSLTSTLICKKSTVNQVNKPTHYWGRLVDACSDPSSFYRF